MSNFQLNIPIFKVDEEQRIVYGYATGEELDVQGDIVDYEASKGAFDRWTGNIREQHDVKRAIGKRVSVEFDDDNKRVLLGAYVSKSADGENAWTKIKEGVLTAFSIGGKIYKTARETVKTDTGDEKMANRILDYDLSEVSIVDKGAYPNSQFLMVKSVDGNLEQVEEMHESADGQPLPWFMKSYAYSLNQNPNSADNTSMTKQSKETTMADAETVEKAEVVETPAVELEKVNVQGGVERDNVGEVVSDERRDSEGKPVVAEEVEAPVADEKPSKKKKADEATETKVVEPDAKKGFYGVSNLADCVSNLTWIIADAEWEAQYEGDKSAAVDKLKAAVAQVGDALVELTQEAVAELKTGDDVELADKPTDLKKMVSDELAATQPDFVKSVVEAVSAKVTEQLKPLEERLKTIESQPAGQAPVREFAVVDKVADVQTEQSEYAALVEKANNLPADATVSERTALAQQLMKANSRMRPVPEVTVN